MVSRESSKKQYTIEGRVKGDPQVIGEELERLRATSDLTAETVVKAARNAKSPLHGEFVWDDTKAAHRYRLVQARTLVRSVKVIKEGRVPTSHYVHVRSLSSSGKPARSGRYEPIETVVFSIDEYQQALSDLQAKLTAAATAVHELQEAAGRTKKRDQLAVIAIVLKALHTASNAAKKLG